METHWPILPPGNIGVTTEPVTAEETEDLLRALIFSGQLGPGDKLPSERELARQLEQLPGPPADRAPRTGSFGLHTGKDRLQRRLLDQRRRDHRPPLERLDARQPAPVGRDARLQALGGAGDSPPGSRAADRRRRESAGGVLRCSESRPAIAGQVALRPPQLRLPPPRTTSISNTRRQPPVAGSSLRWITGPSRNGWMRSSMSTCR